MSSFNNSTSPVAPSGPAQPMDSSFEGSFAVSAVAPLEAVCALKPDIIATSIIGGLEFAVFDAAMRERFATSGVGFNTHEFFGLMAASIYDPKTGFDSVGNHQNGTRYNDKQVDWRGYDRKGWRPNGWYSSGRVKYIHRDTGTEYAPSVETYGGLTYYGFDICGYYCGSEKEGHLTYVGPDGRNAEGWSIHGFDLKGIHQRTRSLFGPDRYTMGVWDPTTGNWELRLSCDGWSLRGFNAAKIHRDTGTERHPLGFDYRGLDENGFWNYHIQRYYTYVDID